MLYIAAHRVRLDEMQPPAYDITTRSQCDNECLTDLHGTRCGDTISLYDAHGKGLARRKLPINLNLTLNPTGMT